MHDVRHIGVFIDRPPGEVYEFASDPGNLPRWAAGLARSEVRRDGDEWIADAPFGKVRVKFVERNPFGVLDHDVRLESGVTVHNPMRVVPHHDNEAGPGPIRTCVAKVPLSDCLSRSLSERTARRLHEQAESEGLAAATQGQSTLGF